MDTSILREYLRHPASRADIVINYCRGKDVLDIGCVHHDVENAQSDAWLHGQIVGVANSVTGVDYLEDEVNQLRKLGYNIISGDVNYALEIDGAFDVVVVGNLIEHLSNFGGLLCNIKRLLKPGGVALISTANPFYREQYFFSAIRNDIIVNPEHTCWIDPLTLEQLCSRFGLKTREVRWVAESWPLSAAIFSGKKRTLSLYTGAWQFSSRRSRLEILAAPFLLLTFRLLVRGKRRNRLIDKYGDDLDRVLYLKVGQFLFGAWWWCRRSVIPTSDINRYELFVSVLTHAETANSEDVDRKGSGA
jgi:SAM-dependent methyltransferase